MKKTVIVIAISLLTFGVLFFSKYFEYKQKYSEIKNFNIKYEKYLDKEILGTDLTTVINYAVNENKKAVVKKDEKGRYIQNDVDSVNIEVEIKDLEKEKIYPMEVLYDFGMSDFVKYYREIKFKCKKIEYNSQRKVKYILFEQVTE